MQVLDFENQTCVRKSILFFSAFAGMIGGKMQLFSKKNLKKMNFRFFLKKQVEGFTFVETLVVLAIGAVLSAGTYLSAVKMIETAKKVTAKNQISQYSSALHSYFLDCGRFPTTEQGLEALWEKPVLFPVPDSWDGPYLEKKISADPWGNSYKYLSAESDYLPQGLPEKLSFVITSFGSNRKEESSFSASDVGDDIVSWE